MSMALRWINSFYEDGDCQTHDKIATEQLTVNDCSKMTLNQKFNSQIFCTIGKLGFYSDGIVLVWYIERL